MPATDSQQIKTDVIAILRDMTSDWDGFDGGFEEQTRLVGDLSFESVEIVQLMVAIEQHFQLKRLATSRLLMDDGRYVDDVSIAQIVDFLAVELQQS